MSKLIIEPSPHIKSGVTTQKIMLSVIIALLPALVASVWIFGLRALIMTVICCTSCVIFEWACRKIMKRNNTISDLSAVVTGMLLAFNLPVTLPFYMAIIGCFVAIVIVKQFFGGIGGASKCGILVKGGNYLEALSKTGVAVFDKTGTLTKGVFKVTHTTPADGVTEADLLESAALAESFSNHPISKSLREACPGLDAKRASDAQEIAGHGVKTQVDGRTVLAGNARLMESEQIDYTAAEGAGTIVYVARDGQFLGSILISDEEKPTAETAMQGLQAQGVRTVMLTGDAPAVAELVAKDLGIDEVHAGLLPADKVAWVEKLLAQKPEKKELAFVGDGINDAPVLMRADIGIAMGALGSDAAIEAADIVLMDDDPAKISLAMRISRKCMRIVYQNIVFALAVKALCLILTALGITNMWWGVFADVGVLILAVLNATRMLNVKEYR